MRPLRRVAMLLSAMSLCSHLAAATPETQKTKTHGFSVSGEIARTDDAAHSFVVRTAAGKETTLVRTSATKLNGKTLAAGDRVAVRYLERDGKKIATSIRIEPPVVATVTVTPVAAAPATR